MKPIPNFPGYLCDEQGNVYSSFTYIRASNGQITDRVVDYTTTPKLLKPQLKPEPDRSQIRPYLVLRQSGKRVKVHISRLIASTFLENPFNYPAVRHLNDISTDNKLSNLAYGTNIVNVKDREANQNKDLLIKELQHKLHKYIQKYGELQ